MVYIIPVVTLLLVVWGWKNPRFLITLLIVALALEISRTWFPHLVLLDRLGAFVGVIDLGRIMVFVLISYFLIDQARCKDFGLEYGFHRRTIWRNPLFLVSGIYIFVGLLSLAWSVDPPRTLVATIRLGVLWFMGIAVYHLVIKSRERWLVPLTFGVMATIVAGIGAYEAVSQHFLWLGEIYQPLGRVNSTFVDANILARFLIIGALATLVWILMASNWTGKLVGFLALLLQMAALLATGSRTGWLIASLVLVFFAVLLPRKVVIFPLIGCFLSAGLYITLNPALLGRITELKQGFWAAGLQRQYLIPAAWDMFMHHPLLGVGSGGFQKTLLTNYSDLVQEGISLSHTAVMTTASELGILGLGVLGSFLFFLYWPILKFRKLAKNAFKYSEVQVTSVLSIFAILVVTTIFISAQAESRFFEDPFLWVSLGYLAALGDLEGAG